MKHTTNKLTIIALCGIMLFAVSAAADVYLEQVTKSEKNGGEKSLSKMYIGDGAIRIEEPGGKMVNITDFVGDRLITLDVDNKEYFTIPLEQIKQDIGQASAYFRKAVQMSWRVEDAGASDTIAGYQTRKIVFHGRGTATQQGGENSEISITLAFWISEEVPVPAGINNRILDALGIEQNPFVTPAIVSELRKLSGYPLRTLTSIDMASVKDEITQEVTLISKIEDDPRRYEIPENFQQVEAK
jgi:hypothetical protein